MRKSGFASSVAGTSWPSRLLLGLAAMLGAWLISCFYLFLVQQAGQPGLKILFLDKDAGFVAALTYLVFVVPVTALPRWVQLRFAYLIVLLSLGWSSLAFHTLFLQWPWTALLKGQDLGSGPRLLFLSPDMFFPTWFGGFTLCALAIYLFLLWRGVPLWRGARGNKSSAASDDL